MRKIYNILMAAAIALGTFTGCEDVPMPFNNPLDYLEPDPEKVVIEPAGNGTKDSPYNVAGVLAYLETLGPDVESTKDIYITGIITVVKEQFSTQYGNAQFVISDTEDADNQFTFYRGLYLGNKKYSNENDLNINENDVVVICGKIVNFKGSTPETVQNKAYVVSINGKGIDVPESTAGEAKGTGTQADPYNVAGVLNYLNTLGADVTSPSEVYIKGKVASITEQFGTQYGNATFTMVDEGFGATFTAYRILYLGNKKYTEGDLLKEKDEVIVCGKVVNFRGNTPETAQNSAYLYSLNGKTADGGGGNEGTPKGSGTQADPYNAAGANAYIATLAADTESDKDIYVKGKIISIEDKNQFNTQYGNCTFYISDDGTENGGKFYVFRTYYLGNVKYSDDSWTKPKAGDEVIICGKVVNYKGNTPETVANKSYIYSLNGKTDGGGGGGSTTDVGSIDKPKTVSEALAVINALEDGATTDDAYYVKGKITKIVTAEDKIAQYKNIDYWISDGTSEIEVFRGKNLDNTDFTGPGQINVGDEVVVLGKLQKYVKNGSMTPEMAQGNYIVKFIKGGDNGGGGGESTTTTLTNGDFETWADGQPTGWKSASSASSATLAQSTDAHGGKYSVNVNGNEGQNKRLASQEISLKAGTYTFTFYVKATTSDVAQARPGFVPVTDGKAGSYVYGDYANLTTDWTKVSYEFTLDADATVCLVVMNPKKSNYSSGKDILVDDATLTKK